MRPPLHHLRAHRRNPLHGHQERRPPRTLRTPENPARLVESFRKTPRAHAQTRSHRRRHRRRRPRSHRARTHHHRNRRNDQAPPQKTRQSRLRPFCFRLYGLQGCPGIHVRTQKSSERPLEKVSLRHSRKGIAMKKNVSVAAIAFVAIAMIFASWTHASAQGKTAAPVSVIPEMNKENIRAHVRFLSHDLLEGRGTGQRGGDIAAEYIATQFALDGLKPAGDDGTFFQNVPMVEVKTLPQTTFRFVEAGGKTIDAKNLEDIVTNNESQTEIADIDAPIVFVGFGIKAPEYDWDDYKGVDLKGKVALLFVNEPPSDDPKFFKGKALTYYGRWTYKFEETARRGALATLIIHRTDLASYGWEVVRNSWGRERSRLKLDGTPKLEAASWIQLEVAGRVLAMVGLDVDKLYQRAQSRDFQPLTLPI